MEFLAADIEKITGVKRNRLQQWLEREYITPSIQVASGHGTRNIWSRNDLYTIALFKKITESGLSRKVVSDFLSAGTIGGDNVNLIYCLLYMREGEKVKATAIPWLEDPSITVDTLGEITNVGTINLLQTQKNLDMGAFDDVYIVNFFKVKAEVDKKIEEG